MTNPPSPHAFKFFKGWVEKHPISPNVPENLLLYFDPIA